MSTGYNILTGDYSKISKTGCVFTYDAIGSYERVRYSSQVLHLAECVSPLMEAEAVDLGDKLETVVLNLRI
ncbi:Proteasome subunit beta type-1 [Gossypium arboreum]|uniref:Proteasome subunit beta type-1 n=1 Tax=Gossypium arboreum TaxID=29729 RepID=A0A0B0NMK3_GOSAR|nr:Proteasome subunit beta type-1 [Gossypium arboreum]